jgi:hypothetical protein
LIVIFASTKAVARSVSSAMNKVYGRGGFTTVSPAVHRPPRLRTAATASEGDSGETPPKLSLRHA